MAQSADIQDRGEDFEHHFARMKALCLELRDGKTCGIYAAVLEKMGDFQEAKRISQDTCDFLGDATSCFKTGDYYRLKKFGIENPVKAQEYYVKSCDKHHGFGCLIAGLLISDKRYVDKGDYKGALKLFEQGCHDANDGRCCFWASEFYRQGEVVPKDPIQAFKYAAEACKREYITGCTNGYLMAKRGEGVPQADDVATIFKAKTKYMIRKEDALKKGKQFSEENPYY